MGSQQDACDVQLEEAGCTWVAAAYRAVQDINSVLQAGRDDLQPLDDAPNYQVLCETARQACCQAEASICSSSAQHQASTLHAKELDCLCQLSTTTLQLSSAVCCDPAVALPLISSGANSAALDQLKGAVKSLTGLWAACLVRLQQQGHDEVKEPALNSQYVWQGILPALATSVKHLLHMSLTSAEFVSSTASTSSQQVPREMCSMSTLNLSWANLTRLLVAIPENIRMQVLDVQDLLHGLQCALQQLHMAVTDLAVQARERQEVLVRFWLQSVSRLTSAAWEDAAQQALSPLLQLTLDVYGLVLEQRQEFAEVQDILQQLLQPRLLACLSSLLSSTTDAAAFKTKLDILLKRPQACGDLQQHQQCLKAQVMVVLDVLQSLLPSWPPELVAVGCRQLLTWTLSTAGQDLSMSLLGVVQHPEALNPETSDAATAWADAAGLELMQGVLQGCLVGLMACWGLLQSVPQQQVELLAAVNRLVLSDHPLVSFLAQQLLADLIATAGNSDLAAQQLLVLHRLLGAAAAAAAVPGAGWGTQSGADALPEVLATVLQACDEAFAVDWLKQHIMAGLDSSSSSSMWLDAGACALLVQECAVLQQLASTSPQLVSVRHAELEECWTQLWSTAQQVAELLEPQQLDLLHDWQHMDSGGGNISSSMTQQHADVLLLFHQLGWLFEAMRALLQLFGILDGPAAATLRQGTVQLALDVLRVSAGCATQRSSRAHGSNSSHLDTGPAGSIQAAQFACSMAVLRVLGAPGQLSLPTGQVQELLSVLKALAAHQEGLHVAVAGVVGNLGVAANEVVFQEVVQQLLSSPHWATRHAAFEALLQLLRHGGLSTGIIKLLPPCMRSSATEATPDVINIVKAHLHRQPDPQAQASFSQQYPQLAAQAMQHLSAGASSLRVSGSSNGSSTGAGNRQCHQHQKDPRSSKCLSSFLHLDNSLQHLQSLLDACGPAAAAEAAPGDGVPPGQGQLPATATQQPAACAEGMRGAQGLLAQAATAARSLQAAEQALSAAESDVRLLLSAASAAARDQSLGADGILLISKQGTHLTGNVASMVSRLRALQDELATLRG